MGEQFERAHALASASAGAMYRAGMGVEERAEAHGRFEFVCYDRYGNVRWRDHVENVVCTEGKNVMLDAGLAGSGYTVVGPFMGLISSVSFTATAAGDTGLQINGTNGWKEAGIGNAPTYSGGRQTPTWSAALGGAKSMSASLTYTFTGAGTVEGCFLLYGTGAVSTVDDAHGKLWSAGVFAGGTKAVASGDSVVVSYSTSL